MKEKQECDVEVKNSARASDMLEKSENSAAFLNQVINSIGDPVFVKDEQFVFVLVNDAFCKFFGKTQDELIGSTDAEIFEPEQIDDLLAADRKVLSTGEEHKCEEDITRFDGKIRTIVTHKTLYIDAKGEKFVVGVYHDFTEHHELTSQLQQAQKLEAIGRLAGGVAHDFNNLLMGIMSYTEMCRSKVDPGHIIRRWLDEITLIAEKSATITRQLLTFACKQNIEPRVSDINDLVGSTMGLLRRLIGEDVKMVWSPGQNLKSVKIDTAQLTQILANLCANSRDAISGVGEIDIETGSKTISTADYAKNKELIPGDYTFISLKDSGHGMDSDTLEHLFEPFFTTKEVSKGTGLGLPTVYGIVHQNHGCIQVKSKVGKGSTFTVYLPAIDFIATVKTSDTTKVDETKSKGETILLVEDEISLLEVCSFLLESLGYKVLTANSPKDALAISESHKGKIDLLLTDVVMPGMDGQKLSEHIVSSRKDVKVIFMSGYTPEVIAKRGMLNLKTPFITKPFSRNTLACKVREVLDVIELVL